MLYSVGNLEYKYSRQIQFDTVEQSASILICQVRVLNKSSQLASICLILVLQHSLLCKQLSKMTKSNSISNASNEAI